MRAAMNGAARRGSARRSGSSRLRQKATGGRFWWSDRRWSDRWSEHRWSEHRSEQTNTRKSVSSCRGPCEVGAHWAGPEADKGGQQQSWHMTVADAGRAGTPLHSGEMACIAELPPRASGVVGCWCPRGRYPCLCHHASSNTRPAKRVGDRSTVCQPQGGGRLVRDLQEVKLRCKRGAYQCASCMSRIAMSFLKKPNALLCQ